MPKKKGTWYEDTVADIAALLFPKAIIKVRTRVDGPDGSREVDVEIRQTETDREFVLLECKDWKAPVDLPAIDALHSKSIDLAPNLTILYSNSGFTKRALRKANRLGIGAMSAMVRGSPQIRYRVEYLLIAPVLSIDQWAVNVFIKPGEAFPAIWEPKNLLHDGKPVQNWLSVHCRELLQNNQEATHIVWAGAFLEEQQFTVREMPVVLLGLQVDLDCSRKYVSQMISQQVSRGSYDHIRQLVHIPSGETYIWGPIARDGWEDYDGELPDVPLEDGNMRLGVVLWNSIPMVGDREVPPIGLLLNPEKQQLTIA